MRFHNRPRPIGRESYDRALDAVVSALGRQSGVAAIYQLGGTSAPGISDLDVVAVFDDDATIEIDPRDALDAEGRYIFTHSLFGSSRALLPEAIHYGAYDGFRLLDGEDVIGSITRPQEEVAPVNRQMAVEFLLMNYIARFVDTTYGVASLRNVLLSTHAMRFDLALLGITAGSLREHLAIVTEWRRHWFSEPVSDPTLREWWRSMLAALREELDRLLTESPLALPAGYTERIASHLRIAIDGTFGITHAGVTLPAGWVVRHRRFVRLQNRMNHFRVGVPAVIAPTGSLHDRRFDFYRRALRDSRARYPRFTPLLNNFLLKVV